MSARRRDLAQRLLGAVDLAIDFATLGEYGLAVAPGDGRCRERPGRETGWEALAAPVLGSGPTSRRGPVACEAPARHARLPAA